MEENGVVLLKGWSDRLQDWMVEIMVVKLTLGFDLVIAFGVPTLEELLLSFIYLFIWGFTSLSTLYRSYHDG